MPGYCQSLKPDHEVGDKLSAVPRSILDAGVSFSLSVVV
jgi:hypothetical protein